MIYSIALSFSLRLYLRAFQRSLGCRPSCPHVMARRPITWGQDTTMALRASAAASMQVKFCSCSEL